MTLLMSCLTPDASTYILKLLRRMEERKRDILRERERYCSREGESVRQRGINIVRERE